jgi:predicted nucleotidyltransferase
MPDFALSGLDQLTIPADIRRDLEAFIGQIFQESTSPPIAVISIGSAVTGDYARKSSDLNLLIIYDELKITDIAAVAPVAQRWFKKRRFSPRFLSRRNLIETARYFQIDFLGMRNAHVLLYGEDVLATIALSPADLRWQLAHEIKRMRMRLKQQYWRTARNEQAQRAVAVTRVSSLLHLYRGVLLLEGRSVPRSQRGVAEIATKDLAIEPTLLVRVMDWKDGSGQPKGDETARALGGIFAAVVELDKRVEQAGL